MSTQKGVDVEVDIAVAIQSVELANDWMEKLLTIDKKDLTLILGEIANRGSINNQNFKEARTILPSFPSTKFAKQINLPSNPHCLTLERFETPIYQLPPSFHEAAFEVSWHTQDVYQEKASQTREKGRLGMLDAYIVPILALFHGRVVDTPREALPRSAYSNGGEIEHQIIMIGGILFFIIELKLVEKFDNSLTQVFLGFLAAAKLNEDVPFKGLRIYGLLTDLTSFRFYSYDPSTEKFYEDQTLIADVKRESFLTDMIQITNKIFGLILVSFIGGLQAIVQRIKDGGNQRNLLVPSSAPSGFQWPKVSTPSVTDKKKEKKGKDWPCRATNMWERALTLAQQCRDKFGEDVASLADMERRSNEALEFLTLSVQSIPRYSQFTGKKEVVTSAELKDLARSVVETTLQEQLVMT